jgi:hypothetical protein
MKKYLLPLILAGAAFAQSSTSVSTSTTKLEKSALDKIKENTSMSYFSILAGPGLKTPTNTNTLDGNNNPEVGSPMSTWNQLSLRYQITKDVRFVINPRFETYFGRRQDSDGNALQNTEGLNPVTGFTIRHQFTEKFSYSGGINAIFMNVEQGTLDNGLLTNPGGFQTFAYKVNDKLNVGSWVWGRYSIYNSAELNDESKKWDFYVAPFAEYSIADNMWIRGWVGKDWDHEAGESIGTTVNRGHDAGIGIDIGINKHFGMYPYISTRWGDTADAGDVLTTDSAAIGAWFYGSIF